MFISILTHNNFRQVKNDNRHIAIYTNSHICIQTELLKDKYITVLNINASQIKQSKSSHSLVGTVSRKCLLEKIG